MEFGVDKDLDRAVAKAVKAAGYGVSLFPSESSERHTDMVVTGVGDDQRGEVAEIVHGLDSTSVQRPTS